MLAWIERLSAEGWLDNYHKERAEKRKQKDDAKKASKDSNKDGDKDSEKPEDEDADAATVGSAVVAAAKADAATAAVVGAGSSLASARPPWNRDPAVIPAIAAWQTYVRARDAAAVYAAEPAESRTAEQEPALVPAPECTEAVTGQWKWLDNARQTLAEAYSLAPSLYDMHVVYKGGDKLVDNSDDEEDSDVDENWQYDEDEDEDEDEDGDFDDFD